MKKYNLANVYLAIVTVFTSHGNSPYSGFGKYIKINADNSYEYYTIVVKNKDDTFKDLYNKHLRFNEQNEFGLAQINYLVPLTSEHSFYNLLSKTKTDNLSKRDLMKEANEIWTGPLLVRPIFNKQHN